LALNRCLFKVTGSMTGHRTFVITRLYYRTLRHSWYDCWNKCQRPLYSSSTPDRWIAI